MRLMVEELAKVAANGEQKIPLCAPACSDANLHLHRIPFMRVFMHGAVRQITASHRVFSPPSVLLYAFLAFARLRLPTLAIPLAEPRNEEVKHTTLTKEKNKHPHKRISPSPWTSHYVTTS